MVAPTVESLDERTKAILSRLDELDDKWTCNHQRSEDAMASQMREIAAIIRDHGAKIQKIELDLANEAGKRSVATWVGSTLLIVLGAIGNMILVWIVGPNGPMHK